MNTHRQIAPTFFAHSPAARQWQRIGVKDHHGIVVPLFSLHSAKSCGIGEYTDLFQLVDWCQSIGFDLIQFLPLNDTGLGTSPYSALSAFALNPIYLGLASLPHLDQSPDLLEELKLLQNQPKKLRIDYREVWHSKKRFIRQYIHELADQILPTESYKDFCQKSDWLKVFAVFKTLKIIYDWRSWEDWPLELQNPTPLLIDQLCEQYSGEINLHCLIQYLCHQQLHSIKTHAEAHQVSLMGDIPILTCRDSADVWFHRDLFDLTYSAGAPPDYFNAEGQNWGFPLYNWDRISELNFNWWIDRLSFASNYYHLYRIDHIVGFFRIWAINHDKTGKDGFFIPEDQAIWVENGRRIMWMMLEKCEMLPIGEDLGVVPPEVRSCLSMLGICGTRVMRWERKWLEDQSYIPCNEYPLDSMTTVSTHDSETLRIWWKEHHEEAKLFAGLKNWDYQPLLSPEYQKEILYDSHHSNSLFHVNLLQEYLALIPELTRANFEEDRINVPGTFSEENWTICFRPTLEQIIENQELKSIMKTFTQRN